MPIVEITPPLSTDKGYLRRTRTFLELQQALDADPSPELIDKMIETILPYVSVPVDREEAFEVLLDASEDEFAEISATIRGETTSADPTEESPPKEKPKK